MTPPVHVARVGLVVVNFASHDLVEVNLGGRDLEVDHRVVVVDSFSSAREAAALSGVAHRHGWELIALPTNVGFGAAMNVGVARARALGCDVFVLVNPDLRIGADVVAALAAHCRRDPGCVVSPRILRPDGSVWFAGGQVLVDSGRTITRGADSSARDGWLSGACLALHERVWSAIGGFAEDYLLYWEDVDLSWRAAAAGAALRVRTDLDVVHDVGGTQGARKSATYYRYNCRNRLVFAAKNLDRRQVAAWARTTPSYARLVINRGDHPRTRFPWVALLSTARGSVEGLWFALAPRRGRTSQPAHRGDAGQPTVGWDGEATPPHPSQARPAG